MRDITVTLKLSEHSDVDRDVSRIVKFYSAKPNPNVLPRPTGEYEKSIKLGLFYFIEDTSQNIIAAAGCFPIFDAPATGVVKNSATA